jgi:hypothetical protein
MKMTDITMLMTANSAEIVNGNLYGMGLGWNWILAPTPPLLVVACTLTAPSRMQAGEMKWVFTLENADGETLETVEVSGRADGIVPDGPGGPGTEVPIWSLIRFSAVGLPVGRYQVRAVCDDSHKTLAFTVIEPQA